MSTSSSAAGPRPARAMVQQCPNQEIRRSRKRQEATRERRRQEEAMMNDSALSESIRSPLLFALPVH